MRRAGSSPGGGPADIPRVKEPPVPQQTGRLKTAPRPPRRPRLRRAATTLACLCAGLALAGCEIKSWINPGELVDPKNANRLDAQGKARPRVQPILGDLDLGVVRTPTAFITARDVRPGDMQVEVRDYQIGPGDEVRVSVNDLFQVGATYTEIKRVSDTGLISMPQIPDEIRLTGLTEAEAARLIDQRYVDNNVFQAGSTPTSVLVYTAQNRTFGTLGNVGQPGRYLINRSDFRLLDAYTLARGGVDPQSTSEFIYIIRPTGNGGGSGGGSGGNSAPANNGGNRPNRGTGGGDPLAPRGDAGDLQKPGDQPIYAMMQGRPATPGAGANGPGRSNAAGGGVTFTAPPPVDGFEIIKVPLIQLLNGDLRYNIIIRPDDTLFVPPVLTGEYYLYGHVLRPGVFAIIPGRKLTIKQAIASGGGLDEVAIPGRTQLIRRIDDQDCFVRIDLAKIFVGQEPDIYLQANDMILVGTNLPAPFIAAFRNAFRITYGFGFLYDRNFAYSNNNGGRLF